MTLQEFNDLEEPEKYIYAMGRVRHLGTIRATQFRKDLYALDAFFLECWFDVEKKEITQLITHSDIDLLEDYLIVL